jgi:cation:H+ antiporter
MLLTNFLLFLFSGFFLVISGIFLVKSLDKIARLIGISEFSAAFIIMAFATSVPELFVGISSAFQGSPQLSMGNIIGANILDLTLLTGIFILIGKGIKFKSGKVGNEVYFMLISMALLIGLYLIGNSLSRIDGVILITLFLVHTYLLIKKRKKYSAKLNHQKNHQQDRIFPILIFILSLIVLFISSKYIVQYSHGLALDLNLPEIFIGIFLISIATTLPELIFGINAVLLNHREMSIGDQTGTIFTNTCLILGIVAIIHPITVALNPFLISGAFMFISAVIFVAFIKSGKQLDIYEGISLIGLYFFFVILQFLIRSIL